jgi:hypothetical protein
MHTIAAWPEYWPLGHVAQFGWLRSGWKVPALQGWQRTEATSLQNVGPAVLASSVWNSVAPKSVLQYQTRVDKPIALLLNPGEQPPWHSESSAVLPLPLQPMLTSPAGQCAVHDVQLLPPKVLLLNFPAGQSVHAPADTNLPAAQLVQTAAENVCVLSAVIISPAAHGTHAPAAPIFSTVSESKGMPMMKPFGASTPPIHLSLPEPTDPNVATVSVAGSIFSTTPELAGMPMMKPFGATTPPRHFQSPPEPTDPNIDTVSVAGSILSTVLELHGMPMMNPFGASTPPSHL